MSESKNREQWLNDFASLLAPLIKQRTGLHPPAKAVMLSCGFPSKGGRSRKNKRIGECHTIGPDGERKHQQIFIHPTLTNVVEVGETLAHELLHAWLPHKTGHKQPFAQAAMQLGLEGKPTTTTAGEELIERFKEIGEQIGEYPHERLDATGPKQTTRLLKVMCPVCGYTGRVTQKWLDEAGAPICPQDYQAMEEAGTEDQATTPLINVEAIMEYKIPPTSEDKSKAKAMGVRISFDPRWSLRMIRKGHGAKPEWWVIDYGPSVITREGENGPVRMAVLGPVLPRLTHAKSREAAVELLEGLREGFITYDDIEVDDNDAALDEQDHDWADDDEEPDHPDSILSDEELAEYEAEERQRESH